MSQVRPPKVSSAAESAQRSASEFRFGPRMLHGFACDSAAEAELLSQQVCIPESAFWTGVITRSCPEVGHVSPGLFAEFEQLMQSV